MVTEDFVIVIEDCDLILIHLVKIPACDRQTDRQTEMLWR